MSELSKFSPQTRVAIYNRVSTEKKVQMEALDVQVAYTRKLVEDNHLTIVDQYIEPETGTEAEHRLEYQRMIRDIKADRIDLVVVKCSDRLCRDQAEWHNFVKLHLQKKFQLYFYLDDHIYDHEREVALMLTEMGIEYKRYPGECTRFKEKYTIKKKADDAEGAAEEK